MKRRCYLFLSVGPIGARPKSKGFSLCVMASRLFLSQLGQMPTVLIAVGTIAGLKLAKYVWSIIWEWA